MAKYIALRLLAIVPLLFAVSVVAFSIAVAMEARGSIAGQICGEGATPECVAQIETQLGLDEPLLIRFTGWLGNAVQGDFGTSLAQPDVRVSTLIDERIWPTLNIVGFSLLIAIPVGMAIGIVSAIRPGGWLDRTLSVLSASFIAAPGFVIAMMLVWWLAAKWSWFDPTGFVSPSEGVWPWIKSTILPSVSLALPTIALVQRQLRSSMSNALQSRYVLAARARGISRPALIGTHALPNAMIPTVTVIGFRAAAAIGLTFTIEQVFAINGMGSLLTQAIVQRNVPVVQGSMMVVALVVVAVNLLVDISYGYLNPKVRLS